MCIYNIIYVSDNLARKLDDLTYRYALYVKYLPKTFSKFYIYFCRTL